MTRWILPACLAHDRQFQKNGSFVPEQFFSSHWPISQILHTKISDKSGCPSRFRRGAADTIKSDAIRWGEVTSEADVERVGALHRACALSSGSFAPRNPELINLNGRTLPKRLVVFWGIDYIVQMF